eukprot:TRINITY_DN23355_c0_g1_i1.p1 TRINITY_DN23355_c0_g1~~TRINITY_DN23355_c0_g1_i1.p1  ORF type:complete len:1045 (-),score=157.44 TRINITY_DN23355_c0_g1_i1:48-3182(-)
MTNGANPHLENHSGNASFGHIPETGQPQAGRASASQRQGSWYSECSVNTMDRSHSQVSSSQLRSGSMNSHGGPRLHEVSDRSGIARFGDVREEPHDQHGDNRMDAGDDTDCNPPSEVKEDRKTNPMPTHRENGSGASSEPLAILPKPKLLRSDTGGTVAVRKRNSIRAIEFDTRADMPIMFLKPQLTSSELSNDVGGLSASECSQAPRHSASLSESLRTVIEQIHVNKMLQVLAIPGFVLGPLLLPMESSCETDFERNVLVPVLQVVIIVTSLLYLVLSLADCWALSRKPLRPFLGRCTHRLRSYIASRKDNEVTELEAELGVGIGFSTSQDNPKVDWVILDIFAVVTLVAEMVHFFEPPLHHPTLAQWAIAVGGCIKSWRWISPSPPDRIELTSKPAGFWTQLLGLLTSLLLFTHLEACLLALVAILEAASGWETWADSDLLATERSCWRFYWSSFYFSAYTVTSIGHGDIVPVNTLEKFVDSVCMIISQMYVAKVFADLNFITSVRQFWPSQRHHRLTQTSQALASMCVPDVLRKRVLAYQDFIWEIHKERRAKECFGELSDLLRFEIKAQVYQRLVSQAPFLKNLSVEALRHIINSLKDSTYLPSDFIVRRGASGSELYFMREGIAGIFVGKERPHWSQEEVKKVRQGDYFGEVAMLTAQKRTAWVMSRTFCVTSMLPQRAIDEVVEADPGCMVMLARSMKRALHLKPTVSWQQVAERIDREIGEDLEEVYEFFQATADVTTALDPEAPSALVTWAGYQVLMSKVKISVLDQKLLWVDLDLEEVGSVSFATFVKVLYSGRRDEEVQTCENFMYRSCSEVATPGSDDSPTGISKRKQGREVHPQMPANLHPRRRVSTGGASAHTLAATMAVLGLAHQAAHQAAPGQNHASPSSRRPSVRVRRPSEALLPGLQGLRRASQVSALGQAELSSGLKEVDDKLSRAAEDLAETKASVARLEEGFEKLLETVHKAIGHTPSAEECGRRRSGELRGMATEEVNRAIGHRPSTEAALSPKDSKRFVSTLSRRSSVSSSVEGIAELKSLE